MAINAAEAQIVDAELASAAAATEALARKYFGEAAYLRLDSHEDRETGEMDPVFEVHYCFDDPENDFDRLATMHTAFMDAYVHITSPNILARVVLKAVPCDLEEREGVAFLTGASRCEMANRAAEAQRIDAEIAAAAVAIEALARQYFGDAAYLRLDTHEDHETGEESTVFEVHYCFEDPENNFDRLVALDQALMDAFVRSVTPEILSRVVLMAIPSDAN